MIPVHESVDNVAECRSIIFQPLEHFQLSPIHLGGVGLASMCYLPDEFQDSHHQHILDIGLILYLQLCIQAIKYIFCFNLLPSVITQEVEAILRLGVIFLALEVGVRESKAIMVMPIVLV